jgi:hypothetical protein
MQKTYNYILGFSSKEKEIIKIGFIDARNKFNKKNPIGCKYSSKEQYDFASGEIDALLKHQK